LTGKYEKGKIRGGKFERKRRETKGKGKIIPKGATNKDKRS
jgi:hypothetical protein